MNIDFLVNQPKNVADVSTMIFDEFVEKTGSTATLEEIVTHFSNTSRDTFPITLVAIENEECIGTVSIFENDLAIRPAYKPWLASLYTKPEQRSKGVGRELIAKTIDVVRGLGFKELYLRTEDTSDYYRKRGWTHVETVSDEKHDHIDIFKISIS